MSLTTFKNPIPPLVLTAVVVLLAFLFRARPGPAEELSMIAGGAGYSVAFMGLMIMVSAARTFRQHKTTLNPIHLEDVSTLVRRGVFRYSRNPMYLGMVVLVFGLCLAWGSWWGFGLGLGLFLYLDRFQIRPEEKVLSAQFGSAFDDYKKHTRRWLGLIGHKQSL